MSLMLENITLTENDQPHIYETNLRLEKATMNVLLGATLSGKTTLMRLMAGLDKPSSGSILWNDEDVTGVRVQDRDIAFVYQQFINYPSLTVYENIASPLRLMNKNSADIDKAVRQCADLMKLSSFLTRKPLELSGGQQQRCALARALVKGSGLVLLDEPLANLDYKLREELRAEIPKIFADSGAIFVYATTEPEEALLLGGNTATLHEGRITQFGKTSTIYRQPKDATTARIFSNPPMNFLKLSKSGNKITFSDGTNAKASEALSKLGDGDYIAGFRPNHLELAQHSDMAIKFNAKLDVTEITGSETYMHMRHGGERWVGLVHGVHDLTLGEEVSVFLDPSHIYTFSQDGNMVLPAFYAKGI
ncbi:MAG: ABC transporter ATP-binding protein [Kordiimonadaceae bacterium]|nr:ABC transporter ATP-binding protein [Kordiimonadaceae bacterium]MBT7583684.1 ABC transporter ATP-binding protein [Kordiimonadaceae bacterium]